MLNFIPTPCATMNELFREPTKHDRLQDMIHMFTMHIHPTTTQKTCQHFDKVKTWTSKEILNNHIVSLVIWKNIANSSIPRWGDINNGKIVHWVNKMPTYQLLVCYFENKSSFHLLATTSYRPTTCISWSDNVVSIP